MTHTGLEVSGDFDSEGGTLNHDPIIIERVLLMMTYGGSRMVWQPDQGGEVGRCWCLSEANVLAWQTKILDLPAATLKLGFSPKVLDRCTLTGRVTSSCYNHLEISLERSC